MTKDKHKYLVPEACYNCKYADYDDPDNLDLSKLLCTITNKIHEYNYGCKKWEEMI